MSLPRLTAPLVAIFTTSGAAKVAGLELSAHERDRFGLTAPQWTAIGALELAGAAGAVAGLRRHPLGAAATTGLALLSAGALATHVRAGDPALRMVPGALALGLAVAAAVGHRRA